MSQWHTTAPLSIADGAAFFADPLVVVTMVSPTSGSTVTSSQFDVQWSFSPGTQSTFRVRIFSDAGGTILEYDSGEVASPTLLHAVPSGSIASSGSFWIRVDITTTDLQAGQSPLTDFTTAFAPSVDVSGLTVTPVSTDLPHLLSEWTKVVPGGSEVFVNYNLYRRKRLGYEASILDHSPSLYLRLKEEFGIVLADSSGSGLSGIPTGVTLGEASLVTDDPSDHSVLFNGVSGDIIVLDAAVIQNIWDGGGAITTIFNADSDGENDFGRLLDKTGWIVHLGGESGGNLKIELHIDFDGATDGHWETAVNVATNAKHILTIYYNSDATANDPVFVLDGVELTVGSGLTETTTPSGGSVRVTDVGDDLYIGNNAAGDRTMDGHIDEVAIFNNLLTTPQAQYIEAAVGTLSDTWTRIANLTTIDTLGYRDYVPEAVQAYDYSITWTAVDGADTLESIRSPVNDVIPAFSSFFAHDWQSPDDFVEIVHQDVSVSEELQMTPVKVWSRQAPTFHIGDGQAATISVSARDAWHDNKAMWNDLIALLTRQRTDGAVFVIRHRGERYFVQSPSARRSDSRPTLFDERVELLEAHVNEAVA